MNEPTVRDWTSLSWLLISVASLAGAAWAFAAADALAEPDGVPRLGVLLGAGSALSLAIGRWRTIAVDMESEPSDVTEPGLSFATLRFVTPQQIERGWRPVALFVSVSLSIAVIWRLPRLDPLESHLVEFLAWVAAILLFLAATGETTSSDYWRPKFRAHRNEILIVSGVLLLALFVRLWQVSSIPFTLSGDEASQGLEAIRVLQRELRNPFTTGWLGVPTMSFFFNSLSIKLFGQTIFGLRLPWVLVGTATVATTYLLVRQLFDWRLALASVLVLATYHYHIHYSRLGSNQVADPFFLSLALFLLYRGLDRQTRTPWALSGMVTGLAFYFYAGARLTPLVILGVLFYLFLLNPRRFWHRNGQNIAVMLGAFLITAAPMLQYAARFPNDFNARVNQVGIIQSGWLANEVAVRGQPTVSILLDQFWRAAMAFNFYSDRTVWYGLGKPLLDPFFGAVFLVGLIYGTLRLLNRDEGPRVVPMVVWWWFGMILGGMLTESPPSSQRLITLAVPTSFFITYALWSLLQLAVQAFGRLPVGAITALGVAAFAVISLNTYFLDYTPQRLYGGQNAELATEIAPVLNELKQDNNFYFVGPPYMYWGFATLPYLVPQATAQDLFDLLDLGVPTDVVPREKGSVFIVVPARRQEVEALQRAFPQGERREILSGADGRFLGTLFTVKPSS
jgi:4-amino-4-deoxy-L-arabinose transferase-like glycosyltransferase